MNIYQALEEFCSYLSFIKNHSKDTITRTKNINGFFIRYSGITEFREVSLSLLQKFFMDGRIKRGWKANTFETYHKTIHAFMKWAQQQGYVQETFLEQIEIPKWKRRLPKRLQKNQAKQWLRYVKNYPYKHHGEFVSKRNHAIYATFVYTGIRRSELTNLEVRDIDLVNLELKVRNGKGDKDRVIPLCFSHAQILKTYFDIRKKYRKTCAKAFTSINRDRGISVSCLVYIHQNLLQDAPVSCNFHQLRHTFATLMIEGGCDLVSLSSMMGHSDIATTMIYVKVSTHHLKSQITKHPLN